MYNSVCGRYLFVVGVVLRLVPVRVVVGRGRGAQVVQREGVHQRQRGRRGPARPRARPRVPAALQPVAHVHVTTDPTDPAHSLHTQKAPLQGEKDKATTASANVCVRKMAL